MSRGFGSWARRNPRSNVYGVGLSTVMGLNEWLEQVPAQFIERLIFIKETYSLAGFDCAFADVEATFEDSAISTESAIFECTCLSFSRNTCLTATR